MNSTGHFAPHCTMPSDLDESFCLRGPLPIISPDERPDFFMESKDAHDQYVAHRSINGVENTTTYHVVDGAGEIAGFISFKVAREDSKASTRIYNSVEYIYVMRKFRTRGLSKLLLEPLLRDVHVALRQATGVGRKLFVRIYSASHPESGGGNRVIRALEEGLWGLAQRYRRVELIGRHIQHVAKARQCFGKPPACGTTVCG